MNESVIPKSGGKCGVEIMSKPYENMACVNNDDADQTESLGATGQSTDNGSTTKPPKRKRLITCKSSSTDSNEDIDEKKTGKDRQSRLKLVSQDVPQRRSPRNTAEAKEARAKCRSLRLKELHYVGEDMCGKLSQEKQALAALFLAEINRKFCSVAWKQ